MDLGFILVNIGTFFAEKAALIASTPEALKITRDGSLPEMFGYLEWAVIVVALVWLSIRDRWLPPFRWALVFMMVLVDDSLQFHETIGYMLKGSLPLPPSLAPQSEDIAEVLVFGAMGVIAVLLTATLFTRNGAIARALSIRLMLIIVFLAFFGVGLDFLHQIIAGLSEGTFEANFLPQVFGLLEDGGEMITASVATAFVLTLPGLETSGTKGVET
ncbi:MAG: hypothetical protein J0L76_01710 [Rhodobacterales bacterium]|nr:hypothetical protein [Rhodobacterales bacterium]